MKKLFTILILALWMGAMSQEQLTINISQDARLAILGDDKGNDAFTPNLTFRSEWQGKEKSYGYSFIYPEFEIAELKGGTYKRYSYGYGVTLYLDNLTGLHWLENVKGTTSLGFGFTDYGYAFFSFDWTNQLSYSFGKVEIFLNWQFVERKDLKQYGEWVRGSGAIGLKWAFFDSSF